MTPTGMLVDTFGRICSTAREVVQDLDVAQLAWRPGPDANPIGWLVWHLTRVQDDHVADVARQPQAWTAAGWLKRFDLPLTAEDIGYGHTREQVASVQVPSAQLLVDYLEDVTARTTGYLQTVTETDLERVVDRRWDPPVTLAVRLVSVVCDDLQHVGQAAYVKGLLP